MCPLAFTVRPPCVRKRPRQKSSRNAKLSSLFGLAFGLRVSKVSIFTEIERVMVAKRRTVVMFWICVWSSRFKSVNSHKDREGRGRETQICRHFWTRVWSSRFKSVNSHRDRGGRGRETQICRHFLDSCLVFASQKCQQSQGSGGSWSRNAELWSLFGLAFGLRISKMSTVTGIGGVVVAKRRTVVTFGLVSGVRVSKVSTFTGIRGVVVAKCRETQNCRYFWPRLGSSRLKESIFTEIERVMVAKRRTVVMFWICVWSSRFKSVNSQRDRGGRGRETQICRHFLDSCLVFASQKCQQSQGSGGSWSRNADLSSLLDLVAKRRREERGEERREKGEERGERRGERGERRREEERRDRRGERKEDRGEEREARTGEERGESMTPDLRIPIGFARGVFLSLRCTCQCLHSGSWILSGFPISLLSRLLTIIVGV